METIGKLMFLVVLIGGLGLGVNEITSHKFDKVDPLDDLLFIDAEEVVFDEAAYEDFNESLLTKKQAEPSVEFASVQTNTPKALWKKGAKNGISLSNASGISNATQIARTTTPGELRALKNYWHQRYHSLLKKDKQLKYNDTQVAYTNYQRYNEALNISIR